MKCNHETRQRIYSGLECPACLKEERDQLRKDLTVTEQQNCDLREILREYAQGGTCDCDGLEHRGEACLHCRANVAILEGRQEDRTKVVEQQFRELLELLEKSYETIALNPDFDLPTLKRIEELIKLSETRNLPQMDSEGRVKTVCEKCGGKGPNGKKKVAEQPVSDLVDAFDKTLDHLRTRECEHGGDYRSCQREIESTLESHRTHDSRLEDVTVPRCIECGTAASMEKMWKCLKCSPNVKSFCGQCRCIHAPGGNTLCDK